MGPQLTEQKVQLKIRNLKIPIQAVSLNGFVGWVETKQKQ